MAGSILRLRIERRRRGLSLGRTAWLVGINKSDLSTIERGLKHVHPGWRQRLCAAFNLPAEELFASVGDGDTSNTARSAGASR